MLERLALSILAITTLTGPLAPARADEAAPAEARAVMPRPPPRPMGSVTLDLPVVTGDADPVAIRAQLAKFMSGFRLCYERALVHGASASGDLKFHLEIDPTGRVSKVEERSGSLALPATSACIAATLRTRSFPPLSGAPTGVLVRLRFTMDDGYVHDLRYDPPPPPPPPPPPRGDETVSATCGRFDAWRSGITLNLEVPRNKKGRAAFAKACGRLDAARVCYEKIRARALELGAAGASMIVYVGPSGAVAEVVVESSSGLPSVDACFKKVVRDLIFPGAPPGTAVGYRASVEVKPPVEP